MNKSYPLYIELKSIIFKTIGIQGSIQKIINKTRGIVIAFMYGSFASSNEKSISDIDLCLIINNDVFNENGFISKINELEKNVSREINYIYYSQEEWNGRVKDKDSFIEGIKKGSKIMLKGDEFRNFGLPVKITI